TTELKPLELNTLNRDLVSTSSGLRNPECDPITNPRSSACIGTSQNTRALSPLEKSLSSGVSVLLKDSDAILSDPLKYAGKHSLAWAVSQANTIANTELQKIPFLAQTTLGTDQTSDSHATFYIDSLLKIATLGKDDDGAPKGLIFGQGRWTGAWGLGGSTLNTGIGTRYRINNDTMLGVNGFWDYRMVDYTSSYSRFGVGIEGFFKDLEIRNNWYIAGTGIKTISETETSTTYERVIPGWDVEIGYRLPNYPQLAFYLKGFNWDYHSRSDNSGIGGSINWQVTPHVNIEAAASNEIPAYVAYTPDNDNNQVFATLKFKYTFNPVIFAPIDHNSLNLTRMTQPVRRRYDVALERWSRDADAGSPSSVSVRVSGTSN
ncbi:MAG: inverse autotransporter beta domain-containing protein, partial [Synechococcus sp.]|nr:inverse autotransporter beta domain-containing protein [Synechococcus sp.]